MRSPVSVVAVIPARAGSVGVPGKNLRRVGGLPLVTRAVRTALATASVDRVVVSTDGLEIASVAAEAGADVVMRPAALSTGSASSESAVVHALDVLRERGVTPSVVVLMQATSPFTTPAELDAAVQRVRSGESDSVFAAVPSHGFLWRLDAAGGASGVNHDASIRPMRQDLAPQFRETGAFYVLDAAGFARSGHRFFGRVGVAIVHDEIDIDTERDLEIADAVEHLHRDSDHQQWDTVQYAEAALGEKTAVLSASGTHIPGAASETARAVVPVDGSSAPRHAQTFWDARDIADELGAELEGAELESAGPDDGAGLDRIDAVVTDFDGVHTDDTAHVDQNGIESVTVHRGDGLGVRLLREAGIPVLILSTERNPVVVARAAKLGADVLHGVDDKASALTVWAAEAGVALENVAYLGNDVNDVPALRVVGWPFVVRDAHPEAIGASRRVLSARGGSGAVRELADLILHHKLQQKAKA